MIALHRLGHRHEPFLLNPDLIEKVEAHPDTVIMLTTGARFLVDETPAEVDAPRSAPGAPGSCQTPCIAR